MSIYAYLSVWLLCVGLSGLLFNWYLVRRVLANVAPRPKALVCGFAYALLAHILVTFVAVRVVSALPCIAERDHEVIGYFVGAFALAFVSFPVGVAGFRFHSNRKVRGCGEKAARNDC